MRKGCGQVDIPEVDNTTEICDEYTYDLCTTITSNYPVLKLYKGDDLNRALTLIEREFRLKNTVIKELTKRIENLEKGTNKHE